MSNFRIGELERRLNNIVRFGNIIEIDYDKARVRVKMGDNSSAWLPWMTERAGGKEGKTTWNPPAIGEQVVVLAPSGELASAFLLPGGIYKKDRPANGDKATISRTTYGDGTVSEYDRESHVHLLQLPVGGKAVVKVGDNVSTDITDSQITHRFNSGGKIEINANGVTITNGETSLDITADGVKMSRGATSLNIISGGIIIKGSITMTGSLTQFKGPLKSNGVTLHSHIHGGVTSGSGSTGPAIPA